MHLERPAGLLVAMLLVSTVTAFTDPDGLEDASWREGWTLATQNEWQSFSWTLHREATNETLSGRFDPESKRLHYGLDGSPLADIGFTPTTIIEFQDHDSDGRFSLGDPVVQQFRFDDMSLNNIELSPGEGSQSFAARFWSFSGPVVTMTTTVSDGSAGPAPEVAVTFHVESFRFQSDNDTMLAIDLRIHDVFNLDDGGLRSEENLLAYYDWNTTGPHGTVGVTFQPYGAGMGHQTLVVFAHPRQADVFQELQFGIVQREPADPGFFEDVSLADWRLWSIGILLMGIVGLVAVARNISREP